MTLRGRGSAAVLAGLGVATVVTVAAARPVVPLHAIDDPPPRSTPVQPLDASPDACERCHAEVVTAWRGSAHAQAFTDPIFRAEYDRAPAASCRSCHDPAAGRANVHGIDCATCHVRDDAILATRASAAGRRAHPIRVDPQLASVDGCAACHQFDHADDGIHDPTEPLQATVDEWRRSDAARDGIGCVDCHMPRDGVARGHDFPGLGSPALLAEAVAVRVRPRRTHEGLVVDVTIEGKAIGHAFPTGDIFRQGVLTLRTPDGDVEELSLQRWEARTTDPDGEDTHVRTVDDTRVPAPGQGVWSDRVTFPAATSDRVDWSLEVRRLALDVADARGLPRETVVVPVASGHS